MVGPLLLLCLQLVYFSFKKLSQDYKGCGMHFEINKGTAFDVNLSWDLNPQLQRHIKLALIKSIKYDFYPLLPTFPWGNIEEIDL